MCLSVHEHINEPVYEYAVQMKILFFWITIKRYDPEYLFMAEELLEKLQEEM